MRGITAIATGATVACAMLAPMTACGSAFSQGQAGRIARAQAARACTRVVGPGGARGRLGNVIQRLVRSLGPGQTGCLRAGTYVEDLTVRRSGITLRSYPGERARLVGRLWLTSAAHDDVISDLTLDGKNSAELPSPSVNGNAIAFVRDEVTDENTNICFVLGSSYGRARATVIERSRIHNCGRLPPRNTEHGVYVEEADGTRIVGNLIYANADRGIQLYPDAQHTLIERNVIDGNGTGVIFSGGDGHASSDNLVQYNVISNSRVRADVESWYPSGNPMGARNLVRYNCAFGGRKGTIVPGDGGFTASANLLANPRYVNAAGGDFRLSAASPCRPILEGKPPSVASGHPGRP